MFILGERSRKELIGVHPDLVLVAHRALKYSTIDFSVHDGIRSVEEQKVLVSVGASRTLKSRHIEGCAVDLVPYVNGKLRWEWPLIYQIALAVRRASIELEIPIRWGGIWDRNRMNEFPNTIKGLTQAITDYAARQLLKGRKAFLDGPHFELPRKLYPPYIR